MLKNIAKFISNYLAYNKANYWQEKTLKYLHLLLISNWL